MELPLIVFYPLPFVCLMGLLSENSRQGGRLVGSTLHRELNAGKYLIAVGDTNSLVPDAWLESLKAYRQRQNVFQE